MVYDTSKGFWDRWVLLEFPYSFVTKEELDKAIDKSKLKIRDESIIERITTDEELSGLLNKFLEGLSKLMVQKGFSVTEGTEEVKTTWIRKANSFVAFCMDKIEEEYDGRISKKDMLKKYSAYCKKHKLIPKSDYVKKRVLQESYGANEMQGHDTERYWEGIKWKNQL
jgi:putative DNA primase/helicase